MTRASHTSLIRAKAAELGFMHCGISKAEFLEEEAPRLESWLNQGMHGRMGYMENHFDMRLDPRKLVEGARSVISLAYNYYTPALQSDPEAPQISRYAYGEDYHFVVKDKLYALLAFIREEIGEVSGRAFVDSAPVLERAWALRSGLGWVGKNTNLINRGSGSFFFLSELIIDLELEYDTMTTDHCGTCTRCMDACPTEAIVEPYKVDGSRCISYFTIELKDEIPEAFRGMFSNRAFGCDICQEVCPWNRFALPHNEPRFNPSKEFTDMRKSDWKDITEETFRKLFKKSPLKRAGYNGLKRNVDFLQNDDD